MSEDGKRAAEAKMREADVAEAAVRTFGHYYDQLVAGETGMLPDAELEPVRDLPTFAALDDGGGDEALDRAVVVKLNGGLGTSMGMTRAKSLIEARDGLSFLDVVARQTLALRRRHGVRLPLVLMHSFHTQADSLAALERYPDLPADVPLDFVQNQEPKLLADDLQPVSWPQQPALEWCPPGHGDLYTALLTSGMLEALRDRGYEYAFVSNVDNLGAVLEPRILRWFATEQIPFLMEVVVGTESERKGGHLARRRADGQLVLRESAQVPDADEDSFRDFRRWRSYNTNNLWVNLHALAGVLEGNDGVIELPLIVNRKTVDPGDASTPAVVQLETAMGAAVGTFAGAQAIEVPRARFAPVKTTNDLLVLRSDAYGLSDDARVGLTPGREGPPYVDLDPDHFKLLRDFDARFPAGPPSLAAAERLIVRGDVTFGRDVVVEGAAEVEAADGARTVDDGARLGG